jgi:hypothetical protein
VEEYASPPALCPARIRVSDWSECFNFWSVCNAGWPAAACPVAHADVCVLYGLGVTIGAGIYVLVGVAAGRSGMHAPLAFVGAALVMAFSAASFAELGTRMPVSASEAAYVQAAFKRDWLSLAVGLLVVATQWSLRDDQRRRRRLCDVLLVQSVDHFRRRSGDGGRGVPRPIDLSRGS